jgi:hypothetical protein
MENAKLEFFKMAAELVAPRVGEWFEASEKSPHNVPKDARPSFSLLEKRGQEHIAGVIADVAEVLQARFAQKQRG